MIPTSIDATDITGATIDGTDVTEITVDGQTVFAAERAPTDGLLHRYDFSDPSTTTSAVPDLAGTADATTVNFSSFDTINGVRSGDFDGDNVDVPATLNQPFDFYSVIEPDTLAGRIGGLPGDDFFEAPDIRSGDLDMFDGNLLAGPSTTTNPQIVVCQFDGANSKLRLNGTQVASGNAGSGGRSGFRIGADKTGTAGNDADWSFGEILVYDPNATGYSVSAVEDYLSAEWAITI